MAYSNSQRAFLFFFFFFIHLAYNNYTRALSPALVRFSRFFRQRRLLFPLERRIHTHTHKFTKPVRRGRRSETRGRRQLPHVRVCAGTKESFVLPYSGSFFFYRAPRIINEAYRALVCARAPFLYLRELGTTTFFFNCGGWSWTVVWRKIRVAVTLGFARWTMLEVRIRGRVREKKVRVIWGG